ncbi:hypothetical protein GOODEAATRI_017787, partial [Goodea atripinnis]
RMSGAVIRLSALINACSTILQPSECFCCRLSATQIRLKRARLANDLNEKIAQRPGPMELVEKKILPVDCGIHHKFQMFTALMRTAVMHYHHGNPTANHLLPKLYPPQRIQEKLRHLMHPLTSALLHSFTCSRCFVCYALQQTLVKLSTDKSRSKKIKEPKSRVKKLKYHQYIPPDQKQELSGIPMDSSYAQISPLIRQDPPSLEKPLPVTASVTTLPINTVLTRSPPLVQLAQLPEATLSSPGNNLETFLDDTEAQRLKLMEELNSPLVNMEMNFSENIPPSGVNLQNTSVDSMDWLDLTLSVPAEGINPLDMSVPGAVFSSDFLDSHELHLNWD